MQWMARARKEQKVKTWVDKEAKLFLGLDKELP
jgi:hypothetical protein